MFYLTTHSTHFIYGYNYGVRHMVKDHSNSERGYPLPPHRLLFPISYKGSFICTIPQTVIAHTTAFVTPVYEHWLEREIAQWVHHEGSFDDPSHHEQTLLPRSYISLPHFRNQHDSLCTLVLVRSGQVRVFNVHIQSKLL